MKQKIKSVYNFIYDVFMTYSLFVLIWIAFDFLIEMPVICLPLLILALASKVIPMANKKRKDD